MSPGAYRIAEWQASVVGVRSGISTAGSIDEEAIHQPIARNGVADTLEVSKGRGLSHAV
jgi:hypothetical protein